MKKTFLAIVAAALVVAVAVPASAIAQGATRIKAGVLTCDISGGIGLIIGSQKSVTCLYTPSEPGPREVYVGNISKFGLDIGATTGGEMIWEVFAPTSRIHAALAGDYIGASGQATVGAGLGANVLVGGNNRTVREKVDIGAGVWRCEKR